MLTLEHRAAHAPEPVRLELVTDPDGEGAHLRLVAQASLQADPPDLDQRILECFAPRSQPHSRAALRAALRLNNQRLGQALEHLERQGRIAHSAGLGPKLSSTGES